MGMKARKQITEEKVITQNHFTFSCSFCHNQGILIIGPEVSICADCVEVARDHVGHIRINRSLRATEQNITAGESSVSVTGV